MKATPDKQGTGVSRALVEFLHALEYDALPPAVVHHAKRCLLDYLGVALIGSQSDTAEKLRAFLEGLPEGASSVIGYGRTAEPTTAALVNGITVHVLELDDGERRSSVHPASSIISAALAVAQSVQADGKALLGAIVAGYEAAIRVGRAIQPSHRGRGFHSTATCGTFGAAVAAGKLLKLSASELSAAFGLAGTSASGLLMFLSDGTAIKQYHPGKAAMLGVLGASLAKAGLSASGDILEGERGFFRAFSDGAREEECTADLGTRWAISEVYFKPYAACRLCHAPIEAVLRLREQHDIRPETVEKIIVRTFRSALDGHLNRRPDSVVGAKMSLPFSVAVALARGQAGPLEFSPTCFADPEILAFCDKVEGEEDTGYTALVPAKRPAAVELHLRDGRSFSHTVELPMGEPENPMDDAALRAKFTGLAASCRDPQSINKILQTIDQLEGEAKTLFSLLN